MNTQTSEQTPDEFFAWLFARLPKPPKLRTPPPRQELLDLAWAAAKAHRTYLFDHGLYRETLPLPMAAADGVDAPFQIESIGGEWSVTRAIIPGDNDWQLLKWRCRQDCLDIYEGRQIEAVISGRKFDLGSVFDGRAEAFIPAQLDLKQLPVNICVGKLDNEETEE